MAIAKFPDRSDVIITLSGGNDDLQMDTQRQAIIILLHWCHSEPDDVSNHQRLDCLLNRLFRRRSKKTSKLRVTGLCEFPAQRASNAENVSNLMTSSAFLDNYTIRRHYIYGNLNWHYVIWPENSLSAVWSNTWIQISLSYTSQVLSDVRSKEHDI